jgi:hypothetical protein
MAFSGFIASAKIYFRRFQLKKWMRMKRLELLFPWVKVITVQQIKKAPDH